MAINNPSKRRKLSHSSVETDQDESASFASFDSSDDEHESGQSDAVDGTSILPVKSTIKATQSENTLANGTSRQPVRPSKSNLSDRDASAALAGGSFKSNFLKLQVDELLKEIRPAPGKSLQAAEAVLHRLKDEIDRIPPRGPLSVAHAERDLLNNSNIAIPFPNPRPPPTAQYKLQYEKPASINVVGSYPVQLLSKNTSPKSIDMLVTMPASIIQDKDYLNHRYFYKRAYYLACLAAALRSANLKNVTIEYDNLHADPLKPILLVRPVSNGTGPASRHAWCINIIASVSQRTFPPEKLLPNKNAVRGQTDFKSSTQQATPFYNSALQADSLYTAYLKCLHSASTACAGFRDACLLGRVWLDQRGHSGSLVGGGFGHFEFAAMTALLLRAGGTNGKPAFSSAYTSYQLFKATLQYIAVRDLVHQPVALPDSMASIKDIRAAEGFPTFFDKDKTLNLLYKMTPWSYKMLRADARTTIAMLGDASADSFEGTFITKVNPPHLRYDIIINIPVQALETHSGSDHNVIQRSLKLYQVLSRGLGDRISHIAIKADPSLSWRLDTAPPSNTFKAVCTIALTLDPANASRLVDHGPAAENKVDAADFRNFWGPKAELRRFKDGSILESLVWSTKLDISVVEQIVLYLLGRHFGEAVQKGAICNDLGPLRVTSHVDRTKHQSKLDAFKQLEDDIRGTEDLPLSVRQVLATDPLLRSTAPISSSHGRHPANVVVQFESSNRWPDDLVAVQRVKIAFLLKLGELLEKKNPDISVQLGLENKAVDIVNQAYLDVTYPNRITFRVRLHHDKEKTLIERLVKDKTAAPATREAGAVALAEYRRTFVCMSRHTQVMQKLCTHFPSLSPAIVTTKKWFADHLLASDFLDELIELLVLRAYTSPWPWQTPSSAKTGFLRTLDFLSRWDWRSEPLIITNLGQGSAAETSNNKSQEMQAMQTRFDAWRQIDPAMNRVALFVASTLEPDGTTWTTDGGKGGARPSKLLAGRMTSLARAAIGKVNAQNLNLDLSSLFHSPLSDYDFVLHVNAKYVSSGPKREKSKYKNLVDGLGAAEHVGYDPVALFVDELRACYGQTVVLLYGSGNVVGGLWNPLMAARPWKVNLGYATRPVVASEVEGEEQVLAEVNREGILGEIARLGGDLLDTISVKKS